MEREREEEDEDERERDLDCEHEPEAEPVRDRPCWETGAEESQLLLPLESVWTSRGYK